MRRLRRRLYLWPRLGDGAEGSRRGVRGLLPLDGAVYAAAGHAHDPPDERRCARHRAGRPPDAGRALPDARLRQSRRQALQRADLRSAGRSDGLSGDHRRGRRPGKAGGADTAARRDRAPGLPQRLHLELGIETVRPEAHSGTAGAGVRRRDALAAPHPLQTGAQPPTKNNILRPEGKSIATMSTGTRTASPSPPTASIARSARCTATCPATTARARACSPAGAHDPAGTARAPRRPRLLTPWRSRTRTCPVANRPI